MCNNCIHKPVCGKFLAIGGRVRECEHFKEEKHGRWEYQWFDAYCSQCGYENRADTVTRTRSDPPFCPRCGAKMDGGTDNG